MSAAIPVVVTAATEGIVDEAVVRRLVREVGAEPGPSYGKNGKQHLRQHINSYNHAARYSPWIVLVDLNHDAECAPPARHDWLSNPAQFMCFRIAVREVETWLLADRANSARFLGVAASRVPRDAESVDHPKELLVNLARQSRRREIRTAMVPRPGSGRLVGANYAASLIDWSFAIWEINRSC